MIPQYSTAHAAAALILNWQTELQPQVIMRPQAMKTRIIGVEQAVDAVHPTGHQLSDLGVFCMQVNGETLHLQLDFKYISRGSVADVRIRDLLVTMTVPAADGGASFPCVSHTEGDDCTGASATRTDHNDDFVASQQRSRPTMSAILRDTKKVPSNT